MMDGLTLTGHIIIHIIIAGLQLCGIVLQFHIAGKQGIKFDLRIWRNGKDTEAK